MKLTYREFLKYGIDLAPMEIEQSAREETYFCTPKGAKIIGWAGVDGIHYCFIRGFGQMVFAVSPMNTAPHYVHPLARNFSDFLRLLLACGGSAAIEQAWQWDAEQFQAFLEKNPPTKEQERVRMQIARQTGLSPMEEPWQYLHALQTTFDYSKIQYTQEFDDLTGNPDGPRQPPEWKVFFEGNFWCHSGKGRAGSERAVCREFHWAGHCWIIPSLYLCGRGVVVDFCMRVEPEAIREFAERWHLSAEKEDDPHFTREQRMRWDLDNPMHLDFQAPLCCNGKELTADCGCGISYNPCLGAEFVSEEAARVVDHYGLDPNCGWVIMRFSYPWATKRKPQLRRLSATMIQERVSIPGPHFRITAPGDAVAFSYGGREHVLTVQEYQAQTMDWSRVPDNGLVRPSHYTAMRYTVAPELPDDLLTIGDCDEGDLPRQASSTPGQPESVCCAMVIGIIGGEDGPTAILYGQDKGGKLQTVCSSLHFEPVEQVEWRMVFHEKQFEDTAIDLISPQ